ncbi:MAG TPA: twin-arginine translocation signal domain-containing protein [Desulfobulbus sp.]|nr:twin-arginine translocation signal domain-containing protein [Desulfobulbus sp.]
MTKQGGGMDQKKNNPQEPEANGKNAVDQSRRKALKKMAVGTAVAGTLAVSSKWSKPVVNSIILPAHAQATNAQGPVSTSTTTPTPTTTSFEAGFQTENITVDLPPVTPGDGQE